MQDKWKQEKTIIQRKVSYEVEQVIETQVNDILLWVVVIGMEKEQMKKILFAQHRKDVYFPLN